MVYSFESTSGCSVDEFDKLFDGGDLALISVKDRPQLLRRINDTVRHTWAGCYVRWKDRGARHEVNR